MPICDDALLPVNIKKTWQPEEVKRIELMQRIDDILDDLSLLGTCIPDCKSTQFQCNWCDGANRTCRRHTLHGLKYNIGMLSNDACLYDDWIWTDKLSDLQLRSVLKMMWYRLYVGARIIDGEQYSSNDADGNPVNVDWRFGQIRVNLYRKIGLTFDYATKVTGSYANWYPSNMGRLAPALHWNAQLVGVKDVFGMAIYAGRHVSFTDAIGAAGHFNESFIQASIWSILFIWLCSYKVCTPLLDPGMLLNRVQPPCEQWRTAPKELSIDDEDRKNASLIDLITGFAGLHRNYAQSVSGAILPYTEEIRCGKRLMRKSLLDCKYVKNMEMTFDFARKVPMISNICSSLGVVRMQIDDGSAKKGVKRRVSQMSND